MWRATKKILGLLLITAALSGCETGNEPVREGLWRGVVTLPGGDVPFGLDIAVRDGVLEAHLVNGPERVRIEQVLLSGNRLTLRLPAFNNTVELEVNDEVMEGTLTLVKYRGELQVMPVVARFGFTERFAGDGTEPLIDVSGRWAVDFFEDDGTRMPAVAEFSQTGTTVTGTFMTPKGDYRFLAGNVVGDTLKLSTFDGAHAFLFTAGTNDDGGLTGDFWSGTKWHESWTARPDENARLPDEYALTFLNEGYDRFEFSFPDLDGNTVSLSDDGFAGKVVIVTLVGSWCPNCHDEAAFMAPFYTERRDRGLEVVALMYEHFGSFEEAVGTTRRFREKFGIEYTTLIAGVSDKDEAAKTLPSLNHVLAFPTTIFVDRSGKVRRIHTGFKGPGTGQHYTDLTQDFEMFVDQLLEERT